MTMKNTKDEIVTRIELLAETVYNNATLARILTNNISI